MVLAAQVFITISCICLTTTGWFNEKCNKTYLHFSAKPKGSNWFHVTVFQFCTAVLNVNCKWKQTCIKRSNEYNRRNNFNISWHWIWKGVSATSQSGGYIISYPRGRFSIKTLYWYERDRLNWTVDLMLRSFGMLMPLCVMIFRCSGGMAHTCMYYSQNKCKLTVNNIKIYIYIYISNVVTPRALMSTTEYALAHRCRLDHWS